MKDRAIGDGKLEPLRRARPAKRRPALAFVLSLTAIAGCGGLTAGCSLSLPMGNLGSDDLATGTIRSGAAASPLLAEMDAEDWRRAKSALDTALDPQGNGASVAWDNPASGAKGTFLPLAQPYPKDDGICRPFSARINLKGQVEHVVQSSACRVNSGGWVIGRVVPADKRPDASSKKRDNLADRAGSTQLN